jgi:predicted flap endonuclease-1-like 5' DNA nuclease
MVGAIAYGLYTGRSTSIEVDDDGDVPVEVGEDDGADSSNVAATSDTDPRGIDDGSIETSPSPHDPDESDDSVQAVELPDAVVEAGEDLTEVKGIGPTKAESLEAVGFETPSELYFASDSELQNATGVGPGVVAQIRDDIGHVDDA